MQLFRFLPLLSLAAALPTSLSPRALATRSTAPQCWKGTSFPAESQWLDFDTLFTQNAAEMRAHGNSDADVQAIRDGIWQYTAGTAIDPRVALAIVMVESKGNVRTVCGDGGVSCGIMQVKGTASTSCPATGTCSPWSIKTQVKCGVTGGCEGQVGGNLQACFTANSGQIGAAARCYNTGSVVAGDWTQAPWGIPSYVQDVANILLGASSTEYKQLRQTCGVGQAVWGTVS